MGVRTPIIYAVNYPRVYVTRGLSETLFIDALNQLDHSDLYTLEVDPTTSPAIAN